MKYIVILGGVMSGIGKGVIASSIGVIVQNMSLNVTAIKIDPYFNQDAGTMSPYEHGECYVLKDGGEVDLDLGNYERFLNISLKTDNSITSGKVFQAVLNKERDGKYLGKTVQMVPHITDEIQERIEYASKLPVNGKVSDVCIIELGGTIGDIESMPFIEAIRQMRYKYGKNMMIVHVSYIPFLKTSEESKTKPMQQSIQVLRSMGIQPDVVCLRTEVPLNENKIQKLANVCLVPISNVFDIYDVKNIYSVPLMLSRFEKIIGKQFKMDNSLGSLIQWKELVSSINRYASSSINTIAIVGKYVGLKDSYLSLTHAITHAAISLEIPFHIQFINSEKFEINTLKNIDAVVIAGGFDNRGVEGKIQIIKICRERSIPILGICLGMQLMAIDIARHLLHYKNANSKEFDIDTKFPIVIPMNEIIRYGGTMRLGEKKTYIEKDSLAYKLYNKDIIEERHRHRYEINPLFTKDLEKYICFSGKDENIKEILEMKDQFYMGCQFHPEFNTYPNKPHPLFCGLLSKLKHIK